MRHQVAGRKLSKNSSQRKALFKSLINSLIVHEAIKTTEPKAKTVRVLVEKLITQGKNGSLQARRAVEAFLQNEIVVKKIVEELGPLFKKRAGGFTRIVRLGQRAGDGAMMVRLELVEKTPKKEKKVEPAAKPAKVEPKAKK